MSETNTEGGAAIQGDVSAGKNVTGRDASDYSQRTEQRMVDQRRDDRRYDNQQQGGNVNFQSQDNAVLWREIVGLGNQLSDMQERLSSRIGAVDFKLDDLPNRVGRLELKVDPVPMPLPIPVSISAPVWLALGLAVIMLVALAFFAGGRLL